MNQKNRFSVTSFSLDLFLLFVALFGLMGCASQGFNRGPLEDQVGVTKPVVDDQEIKAILSKKSQLPRPFKLAVHFRKPEEIKNQPVLWRWTESDREFFAKTASELKTQRLVSEVFPLHLSSNDDDLKSLRLSAARQGADALLVVTGAGEIDRYLNPWGWSFFLLVPALFVQGSSADTLFLTSAALWDVRNEFLYLSADSEATTKRTYAPAFSPSDKDLLNESKTQSLEILQSRLLEMMKGIKK